MKLIHSPLFPATLLSFGLAIGTEAQPASPVRQEFGTGELPGFLKTFDLNNDGRLSIEERQAYEKALRDSQPAVPGASNPWDLDGDGKLSDAEKLSARGAIAQKVADERSRRFGEIDTDADGYLNAAELAGIPQVTAEQVGMIIANLDKDGDGKVGKAEFLAAMAPVEPPIPPCPLPPAGPPVTVPAPAGSILAAFDTNKDGLLTPAERAAAVAVIDTSGDGQISAAEWKLYILAHVEVLPIKPGPPASGL